MVWSGSRWTERRRRSFGQRVKKGEVSRVSQEMQVTSRVGELSITMTCTPGTTVLILVTSCRKEKNTIRDHSFPTGKELLTLDFDVGEY